jgi:hypothetical protein
MAATSERPAKNRFSRLESRFETLLWQLRLAAILPVVMTALSSIATFILGSRETLHALELMAHHGPADKKFVAEVLGGFIGGIDLYLIGFALLIFSYGTYELLISAIDPARGGKSDEFKGLLDVNNLDDLKGKLSKVLVVALLVFAFKAMIGLPIETGLDLLYYCSGLVLLTLSAYLVGRLNH